MYFNAFRDSFHINFRLSSATNQAGDDEDDFFDNEDHSGDEDSDTRTYDGEDTDDSEEYNPSNRNRQTIGADFEVIKRVDNLYYE